MELDSKYEEALERARKGMPIDEVFPELRESEDEEIRKALVNFFKNTHDWVNLKYDGSQIVAYLEKQKEQKSLNISAASEWLRKHVCRYMNSEYNEFHKSVEYDGSIDEERLINDFEGAMQKEQKPAEWSEEDELFLGVCKNALSKYERSDKWDASIISEWLENRLKSLRPLQKHEQEEIVLYWEKGHPEPYKSVLILRHGNVVVEGEWNEKMGMWYQYGFQCHLKDNEVEGWMDKKSLLSGNFNPQPHWKPSEEQMKALKDVINRALLTCRQQVPLESLYNDLQKLL